MNAFFDSADRQRHLTPVARSWLGTPFHPHAAIRGVGVDCVHLLAEIYRETGLFAGYKLPRYTMDGGDHADASQVLSWLEAHPNFWRAERTDLATGNLVTFRLARVAHHVGLALEPPSFIHSIRGYGVIESRLDDPTYAKRLGGVLKQTFAFAPTGPQTITNAQIVAALGAETDFVLRTWFESAGRRSLESDQITVRKV